MGKENGRRKDEVWEEIEELYNKMYPMIRKLAEEVIGFDRSTDLDDMTQQAYLAIWEACLKYDERHSSSNGNGKTRMKKETYAYWYVRKYFARAIDSDRVLYDVYDPEGEYLESLYGKEYARCKKSLEDKGCTFLSRPLFVNTAYLEDEYRRDPEELYGAVFPEYFNENEISSILPVKRSKK